MAPLGPRGLIGQCLEVDPILLIGTPENAGLLALGIIDRRRCRTLRLGVTSVGGSIALTILTRIRRGPKLPEQPGEVLPIVKLTIRALAIAVVWVIIWVTIVPGTLTVVGALTEAWTLRVSLTLRISLTLVVGAPVIAIPLVVVVALATSVRRPSW